jgi:hypothetical protein
MPDEGREAIMLLSTLRDFTEGLARGFSLFFTERRDLPVPIPVPARAAVRKRP